MPILPPELRNFYTEMFLYKDHGFFFVFFGGEIATHVIILIFKSEIRSSDQLYIEKKHDRICKVFLDF